MEQTKKQIAKQRYNSTEKMKKLRIEVNKRRYRTEVGRIRIMIAAAKKRSELRNLAFDLTEEDIRIPEFCPLLGIKIKLDGFKNKVDSPSLDRIDSNKGYTKDNVWIISSRANIIKNNATVEELELIVQNLKKHLNKT